MAARYEGEHVREGVPNDDPNDVPVGLLLPNMDTKTTWFLVGCYGLTHPSSGLPLDRYAFHQQEKGLRVGRHVTSGREV